LAEESAQILERISDGFYALDRDWRFTYVNARFEALTGTRRDRLIGRTIWEAFPRLRDTAVYREHLRAVDEARPVFYETGDAVAGRWIESTVYPGETGLSVYLRDVTDRQQAELMLRDREATLRSFYANAPVPMGVVELVGDGILHIYDNPATCRFFHRPAGSTAGQRASAMGAPPAAIREWMNHYRACEARGEPVRFEYEHAGPDGRCWLSVSVAAIGLGPSGRTRFCYVAEDVTARKRAESALRASEERFAAIFRQAAAGLVQTDLDGRIVLANDRYCAILGRSREALLGLRVQDLTHPEDLPRNLALLCRTIETGEPFVIEKRYLRPDGTVVWVNNSISTVRDADGRPQGLLAVTLDVTARKRAEAQQTLLTAELSHRVKNTLAVVQAIASQTLRRASSPESFAESFGGRLRALASTHGLLTRTGWHPTDLRVVLQQAVGAHAVGPRRFEIEGPGLELPPKEILTLGLVLHELATNAAKYGALSTTGGRVSVRWALEGLPDRRYLRLVWIERNGPPVTTPVTRGFGIKLIGESVAYELGGTATLAFETAGLRCEIVIPWDRQPATGPARAAP
jgi:PAS domain S-box-containing protein